MISFHRILLTYMVAAIMHVPFPVFDGDNLRSGERRSVLTDCVRDLYDVDFILLGCNPPDDSDDGPIDDDPEDGSISVFGPSYACQKTAKKPLSYWGSGQHELVVNRSDHIERVGLASLPREIGFRHFSFGKLHQSGTAHVRC